MKRTRDLAKMALALLLSVTMVLAMLPAEAMAEQLGTVDLGTVLDVADPPTDDVDAVTSLNDAEDEDIASSLGDTKDSDDSQVYLSIRKSTQCYVENRHNDSEHPDVRLGT